MRRHGDMVGIVALDNDIAEVDANAKPHKTVLGQAGVSRFKLLLHFERTAHRFDGDRKLRNHAVTGAAEHAATMIGDWPVDDLAVGVQRCERRFLVILHEARVTHFVGSEYSGETPLH